MLNEGQQRFLDSLSPETSNRMVELKPWSPEAFRLAEKLKAELAALTNCEVSLTGSLAYRISGEEDIDLTILCPRAQQERCMYQLEAVLGNCKKRYDALITWEVLREGFHVGVWLVDPEFSPSAKASKQLDDAFKENPDLVRQYEQLKISMNGKTFKEYQAAKYEFYNRVLGMR